MPLFFVIDPGLRFAGISIIDENSSIKHSETLKFNTKESQQKRIYQLYRRMKDLAEQYHEENNVNIVITEYQFVSQMSWIVGCLMTFAGSIDAKLIKFTPSQWKKLSTGKGNIAEDELRNKIIELFPNAIEYSEHQIDTLGMYLAHINQENGNVTPSKKSNKRKNSG